MKAIILAAGKGTRLHSEQSDLPKVLRRANGKSLLSYVTKTVSFIDPADTVIVIGYRGELVEEEMGPAFSYAWQREQLGTGHAVSMAKEYFTDYDGDVLVLYGDMPLFTEATYRGLCEEHRAAGNDCTVLTSIVEANMPYGRIVRDSEGKFIGVVEDKDCTPEQKAIKELNVGVYAFRSRALFENLENLKNNNAQGEYYLTDIPKILMEQHRKVGTFTIESDTEIVGVNTPEDLAFVEAELKKTEA